MMNSFSNAENIDKDDMILRTSCVIRNILAPMLSLFKLRRHQVFAEQVITLLQQLALKVEVIFQEIQLHDLE